jgi:hypothetical protein
VQNTPEAQLELGGLGTDMYIQYICVCVCVYMYIYNIIIRGLLYLCYTPVKIQIYIYIYVHIYIYIYIYISFVDSILTPGVSYKMFCNHAHHLRLERSYYQGGGFTSTYETAVK